MIERRASVVRTTERTEVKVMLNLDGEGGGTVQTGIPFLDRMLGLFARHGGLDLEILCKTSSPDGGAIVEEVAACLGLALDQALGANKGTCRSGHSYSPVEDNLARAVVEISGYPCLVYLVRTSAPSLTGADPSLVERFWRSFVAQARINLHIELLYGGEGLPAFEAVFKAAGLALSAACRL